MKRSAWLVLLLSFLVSSCAWAINPGDLEQQLNGAGLVGWVHGASTDQGLYVFTYRNPNDFFDYIQMSLITGDPAIQAQLSHLTRNDKVKVQGHYLVNPSPQKHIQVTGLQMVKPYQNPYSPAPYAHEARLPEDLLSLTEATFLVHAVGGNGHILVTEYKDSICPIFVKSATLAQGLYRGDLVKLKFKVQEVPSQPVHLSLDEAAPQPITVLEAIKDKNGHTASFEGALVLFPKSPEIIFNVFAVQEELVAGLKRQYTIVNMDSPTVFTQIRQALQAAWDAPRNTFINGRNKLVSQKIRVRVSGTFNEVDPSQANPQILVTDVSSVQIINAAH